jgi:hypothetical protein
MSWVAVGVGAVSVIGGAVQGQNAKSGAAKAKAAQEAAAAQSHKYAVEDADAAYNKNWESQQKAQQINQGAYDTQLKANRANQTSDFGSTSWNQDPTTGQWSQTNSLDPSSKATVDTLRGNYAGQLGAQESGFNVNNDVMNAMRAQSAPQQQQQRDRENARLAAMGLGTGSGAAWGTAQDALNRSDNDMEQKNILGGFDAWNQTQANNRSNMAASQSLESSLKNNSEQGGYATAGAATVNAPTWNMGGYDNGQTAYNQQMGLTNAQNANIGNVANGIGGAIGMYGANQPKTAAKPAAGTYGYNETPNVGGGKTATFTEY